MGFSLEMFTSHPASSSRAKNVDSNGVIVLQPGEQKHLEVDLQHTNTLVGDISIQGVSNLAATVAVYYSNWSGALNHQYGFQNLDPDSIQGDTLDLALWFKHNKTVDFIAQTPKHQQMTLPICRFVRVVIKNPHDTEMIIALHCLFV